MEEAKSDWAASVFTTELKNAYAVGQAQLVLKLLGLTAEEVDEQLNRHKDE